MKTILIVEDETSVRESLRDWLTDEGYRVVVAGEGDEALKLIEEQDFDTVLLDLRLPGKDGLQVLGEARLKKPTIRGIIITAYPTVGSAVDAMKLGAIDFLPKPIDLERLNRLMEAAPESADKKRKTVLIVDDEASVRESLKDWLCDAGYQAETTDSGEKALELIKQKEYGLLIVDLKLPGKNGIEVLKEARRVAPDLGGIIITAYPSVESAVEAMRVGALEYLAKPLALSEIEKIVAEYALPDKAEMVLEPTTKAGLIATLKVLDRAADNPDYLARLSDSPEEALAEYTDLTAGEREALIDGDIKRIESWIGHLDKKRATWLWCRLSQEKW